MTSEILCAGTVESFTAALKDGPWDAVIADYEVPGFATPAGLSQISDAGVDVPYIFLSDPVGETAVAAAFKAGASDYVRRDDLQRLVSVVKRQVRRARVRRKRREEEEAFEQSERKYRVLFDSASDAIIISDFDGNILDANKIACVRYGYTQMEICRKKIIDLDAEESAGGIGERMERIKRLGVLIFERVHTARNGQRIPVEVSARIIDFGGRKSVLSIIRDIRERKESERALRESERRFRFLAENSLMGIGISSGNKVLFANQALLDIFGYSSLEEISSVPLIDLVAPHCRDFIRERMEKIDRGETVSQEFQYDILRRDGSVRTLAAVSSRYVEGGAPITQTIFEDITERKRTEEELRLRENQLVNAMKIAELGDWEYDVATDTFTFNDNFYAIFGTTAEKVGGYTMRSQEYADRFLYPDDREVVAVETRMALETRDPKYSRTLEHRIIQEDGSIGHIVVRIFIVKDEKGKTIKTYGVNQNITERKNMEEALQWELALNSTLADLSAPLISPEATIADVSRVLLDRALQLTLSANGFVAVDEPPTDGFLIHSSDVLQADAADADLPPALARTLEGRYEGLMGYALNTRTAFFTNDPRRHPAYDEPSLGHTPIERFLAVPVLLGTELVGEIALANPGRDYTDRDLDAVRRLAGFFALAVQSKRSDERVRASLKEKTLLLKEIHHRIKNNLQVVMSLLNLQSFHLTDERARALFRENQLRIRSMALVHERLYRSSDLSHVDFKEYISKLAVDLFRTYRIDVNTVKLSVKSDDVTLGIDASVPCGLIINELLLNSLKHAFPRGRKGRLAVSLERSAGDQYLLTVADDGVGLGKNTNLYDSKSLGFSLVVALTEQLGGTIRVVPEQGTKIEITFKAKE